MKRSDFIIKLVSGLLFAAVVCYIGYYLYDSNTNAFKTTLATTYSVEDGVHTQGYLVRDEQLLYGDGGYIAVTAKEGDKLSAGDAYAVEYADADAMERASQIMNTRLEMQQVQALIDSAIVKDRTDNSVLELAYAVNTGDYASLDETSIGVKTYIMGESSAYGEDQLKEQLEGLQEDLEALEAQTDSDTQQITTEVPGTFSAVVDGNEDRTLEDLTDITPSGLSAMFSSGDGKEDNVIGKLVTGVKWYYAAIMEAESAKSLTVGETENLSFASVFDEPIKMTVHSVGKEEDGECTVIFSCSRYFYKVASAREMEATVVLNSYSGIRVPKEALHLDDEGSTYVYIVAGLQASMKYVDIVGELDDYYIVSADKSAQLHVGDEIIVSANDIYDGKVIL